MDHLPKTEGEPYQHKPWPKWCVGPDGQGRAIASEAEVPEGWSYDGQTKKSSKAPPAPPPIGKAPTPPAPPAPPAPPGSPDVDASGAAFDPALHAATRTKTGAGLWRMKVGVARPTAPATDL